MAWCGNNHLILNMIKTNEMIGDFRRTKIKSNTISLTGEEVEVVMERKYLGIHLDNILDWRCNTDAVYKKGQSKLSLSRKLRSFSVCNNMYIFYESVVWSSLGGAASVPLDLKKL